MIKIFLTALLVGTATHSATVLEDFHPAAGEMLALGPEQITPDPPPRPDVTRLTDTDLASLVERYARPQGVSVPSVLLTVKCEANRNPDGTWNATGRSNEIDAAGRREDSWGLAQIHLPDHREISRAQAQDPDFAMEWMAYQFAHGGAALWTCWRSRQK